MAPNPDLYYPGEDRRVRVAAGGAARLIASVCIAYGRPLEPLYLGKPHEPIFHHNHARLESALGRSVSKRRVLVVGDSLASDAAGAAAFGCRSALVLTGATHSEGRRGGEPRPDLVFRALQVGNGADTECRMSYMPPLFWLDVAMLGFTALVGFSLVLTIAGAGAERALTLTFCAYCALTVVWAACGLVLSFSLWLGFGNSQLLGELGAFFFGLLAPAALAFSTRCVGARTRAADLASLGGVLAMGGLAVPLFSHRLLSSPQLAPNGTTEFQAHPLLFAAGLLPVVYLAWSLSLQLKGRRGLREPLAAASILLILAGLVTGGLLRAPFPLLPLGNALALCLLGYSAMRRQVFSPARESAQALQERARRMELVARVGQRATAILELDELLGEAISLIRTEFSYFNVSIFLAEGSELVLRASAARPELENRVRLAIGREGISGWVAQTGEPLLVADVEREPRYLRLSEDVPTRSELAVPIKLQGLVIGVLDAQSTELSAFAPIDLFTLQTVADQLAIAIDNARLYAETRRRAERLAVVNRVSAAAGATLRLDDLLATTYREVAPVFQADAFFIALYDEMAGELDFRFQMDEGKLDPPNRQPLGGGLSSWVVGNRRPLLIREFEKERESLPVPDIWGSMKLPASWLGVPMRLGERVTGVISVQAYRPRAYSEEDQLLLATIADQVAVAVENARLFEAAQSEIAERRVAEQVLRESEEKFRNLAEQSPNMIFINSGGRVVYANRRCEGVTGYTRGEFYSSDFDFLCLIAPEDRERVQRNYSIHLRGEEVAPYEYSLLTKSGRRIECILAPGLLRFGGQNSIMGIITDITARKRWERMLAGMNEASLAMARVLDPEQTFPTAGQALAGLGLNSLVFLAQPAGTAVRLAYSSHDPQRARAVEALLGRPAREFDFQIEGSGLFRQVMRDRQTLFLKAEEPMREALPEALKPQAAALAGALNARSVIIAPLITKETVIGMLVVHSADLLEGDVPAITAFANQMAASWLKTRLMQDLERSLEDLQRAQGELVQAQKMEAIGRLAGGIAHDFNNVLTAISGYTQLLLDRFPEPDGVRADLEEIKKATAKAGALTRQLLAFGRKQVLQPRVLDLNEVIVNMEKMLRRLIGEHIELASELTPGLGRVRADPLQVEQVIMNLAINAADAMPHGGRLVLETGNVQLEAGMEFSSEPIRPGPYVFLAVSDNGIGMGAATRDRLFEPFFTTKPPGKGTGLGLSTAYGIVVQSGGHIQVYSRSGYGSCFKIFLPRVQEAPSQPPVPELSSRLRGSEAVLLVEEEKAVRDLARRVLSAQGYEVLDADQGDSALAASDAHRGRLRLVITDLVLPGGLSGRELAEKLRAAHPQTRFLFISGFTAAAARQRGLLGPGGHFLLMPFSPMALARRVREVLDSAAD